MYLTAPPTVQPRDTAAATTIPGSPVTVPRIRPAEAGFGGLSRLLSRPLGSLLLLCTAVFVVYAPALSGQLLWDDVLLIKTPVIIRSPVLCLEAFRHTLANDRSDFYRPTQTLTFIADYWFAGTNPFAYHLTSLLIHAANAVLLCLVLRLVLPILLRGEWPRRQVNLLALGVALVWAVHPVHNAAVAYASGTADPLAMFFCLAAVLLCERSLRFMGSVPRFVFGAGAFAALLLGLCSKEISIVWLLLFLSYLFFGRPDTSRRARWIVVACVGVALVAYLGLRHLPPPSHAPPFSVQLPSKPVLMLRALGDYGSLLIFPKDLFMERQVFAAPGLANAQDAWFYHLLLFDGLLVLIALGLGAWWPGQGRTLRRVGAAWFLIGYLPISNLFLLNASVAEHWLYLPSIGFLLFLTGVGLDVLPLLKGRRTPLLLAVFTLMICALGLRTWYRTFDWADDVTFFRQTIADGGDVPRARAGLATAYLRLAAEGKQTEANDQAIALLRGLIRRQPTATGPRINLGIALGRRGQFAEAKSILESVIPDLFTQPQGGDPRELGMTVSCLDSLEKGDASWLERRKILLDQGAQHYPNSWELTKYLVQEHARAGERLQALTLARRFVNNHWWHGPAWIVVGELEKQVGNSSEALVAWQQASRLDVHDAEALDDAAALAMSEGHLDLARDLQARAVNRQPDSPLQHVLLAKIFSSQMNPEAAQAQLAAAASLVDAERKSL